RVASIAISVPAGCVRKCGPCRSIRLSNALCSMPSLRIRLRSRSLRSIDQLEEESQQLERQWALRRERARYEAERARRQYDAVEPENRLVARSLERAWEDKLRAIETIEQEYARWRTEEPVILSAADRTALQSLAENLPQIWHA